MENPIAKVIFTGVRHVLFVAGHAVAMEGDICRDMKLPSSRWTVETLQKVADDANNQTPGPIPEPEG